MASISGASSMNKRRLKSIAHRRVNARKSFRPQAVREGYENSEPIDNWRIFEAFGILAAIIAIFLTWSELRAAESARELERSDYDEERLARAWSTLTRKASGNTAKGDALSLLLENHRSISGADLSCRTMGGGWDEKQLSCERPVVLTNVKVDFLRIQNASGLPICNGQLNRQINFDGVVIRNAKSSCLELGSFNGVASIDQFEGVFKDPQLMREHHSEFYFDENQGSARGAQIQYSQLWYLNANQMDLSGLDVLHSDLRSASFFESNLSNSRFVESDLREVSLVGADLSDAVNIASVIDGIVFCDSDQNCVSNMTRDFVKNSVVWSEDWDSDILPSYLKTGEKQSWPRPYHCRSPYSKSSESFQHLPSHPECLEAIVQLYKSSRDR